MTIKLEELDPQSLSKVNEQSSIVYLPLGTLEWHQHHLPFGVDAFISRELCERAVKKTGGCIIPTLFFGTDREHQIKGKTFHGMDVKAGKILPGNFYFLKEKLFFELLEQIVNNVEEQGFKKLVIVSAHSGTAQQKVIEKVEKTKRNNIQIIAFPGKLFEGGIDHAGKLETSYMLAIKPELVNISVLGEPPFEALIGDNPKEASAELGERMLKQTVDQIVKGVSFSK